MSLLRGEIGSHLPMRGAPPPAIQQLAAHRDLSTTQRYMHSPSAVIDAIRLLEGCGQGAVRGHIVETGG